MSEAKTVSWNEWAIYVNKRLLSVEDQTEVLTRITQDLRNRVYVLEKPMRQEALLKLVNEATEPHMITWFSRRISDFSYAEFLELVEKGEIVKVRRGNLTLYQVDGRKTRK